MGRLINNTKAEKDIIHSFTDAINSVKSGGTIPLNRFHEGILDDLTRVMESHYNYNDIKMKYYMCRRNNEAEEAKEKA